MAADEKFSDASTIKVGIIIALAFIAAQAAYDGMVYLVNKHNTST